LTVASGALILSCLTGLSKGLRCYDCNSFYTKDCGDPFSNHTIQEVDCTQEKHKISHLPPLNGSDYQANICRKSIQTIHGKTRIIRGCGWLPNPRTMQDRACFTRTGTHEIMVEHCVCYSDRCNSAPQLYSLSFTATFCLLVLASLASH